MKERENQQDGKQCFLWILKFLQIVDRVFLGDIIGLRKEGWILFLNLIYILYRKKESIVLIAHTQNEQAVRIRYYI